MIKIRIIWMAILAAFILSVYAARTQGGPASGSYQIVSGSYITCCGFAGLPFSQPLPNQSQGFVQLTVDPQSQLATMTVLGQDMQSVFGMLPCPPDAPIYFSFSHGFVFSNVVEFHVDPGPPPYGVFWSYTISNAAKGLRIDGVLGTTLSSCWDAPTRFSHSNVVAVLLPARPVIQGVERDGGLLSFRFTGEPGYDYFVEFSESLPATSWLCLTNYQAKLQTIEAVVTDPLTNGPARFYRIRKQDCLCDGDGQVTCRLIRSFERTAASLLRPTRGGNSHAPFRLRRGCPRRSPTSGV